MKLMKRALPSVFVLMFLLLGCTLQDTQHEPEGDIVEMPDGLQTKLADHFRETKSIPISYTVRAYPKQTFLVFVEVTEMDEISKKKTTSNRRVIAQRSTKNTWQLIWASRRSLQLFPHLPQMRK